ncbi:MAG: hypothetical protein PHV32_06905 [Eubacteriales bacterium]|nr:hypothetical protein [Eubacteriales bacterium]
MTNEELMRLYYDGNESALAELHNQNMGFIYSIAVDVATIFGCYNFIASHTSWLTSYTKRIISELCSEGDIVFFSLLYKKRYDESKGMLTTYLYPHLRGAMFRYMERVVKYNNHVISIEDFKFESDERDPYSIFEDENIEPPHRIIYRKICAELLGEIFESLSLKDKMILGQVFGVYGYKKKSLDDIAFEQVMKIDGVIKAKNQALERLRAKIDGSKLQLFRWAYHAVMDVARKDAD